MRWLDSTTLQKRIRSRVSSDLIDNRIGCAEIAVTQDGKRIFHELFGNDGIHGNPLLPNRLFRIASMTKPTTAWAVLREWELGRINLNAPLSDYLPAYAEMSLGHVEDGKIKIDGTAHNRLRVFHLLTHTSGIDNGAICNIVSRTHPRSTLAATADYYAKCPLAYEPFSTQGYSESGAFDIAARIVELTSGEAFDTYLQKYLFDPLDMHDTTYTPSAEQWSRMVTMHGRTTAGQSINIPTTPGCVYEDFPASSFHAGGGLASTMEDYLRFADMLLLGGITRSGKRIISESAIEQMRTPHVPESIMPGSNRWGYGVRVVVFPQSETGLPKGTFGWSGAFGTHFWVDPVNHITAVYLRNSTYDSHGCGSIGIHFEEDVSASLGTKD